MNGNKMTKREEGRKDGRRRKGIQGAAQGIEGEKRIERERPGGREQQGQQEGHNISAAIPIGKRTHTNSD